MIGEQADIEVEAELRKAGEANILIIASTGNDKFAKPRFPASSNLENILSVSATNGQEIAGYSNKQGDIGAEGSVETFGLNSIIVQDSGTSYSAPAVSLVAAMILVYRPHWNYKKSEK